MYNSSDVTITASAIGNPYLFTGQRYDPESGNYYYRARYYSPSLGRFLSQDPLGFNAGDYNLYRYVFNSPTNTVDPTGEVAWFIPWLLKASAEAAADALMQAMFNYFFDPTVTTVGEAVSSIDPRRVGWAFVTGLLPGDKWVRSIAGAGGDVLINYLDAQNRCEEYPIEQMLKDFAISLGMEIIGDYIGDAVAKYGTRAVAGGLRRLGFDELAEKLLRRIDDIDDVPGICFKAGTPVATVDGLVEIETVSVGDQVWGVHPETRAAGLFTVTAVFSYPVQSLLEIVIGNESIYATREHPFWVTDAGWVGAENLAPGDCVQTLAGICRAVVSVRVVYTDTWVYNFTVGIAHTYFVGNGQWLVHNRCDMPDTVKFGYEGDLKRYIGKIPGVSYLTEEWWLGLVPREILYTNDWQRHSLTAMENARQINFIVDSINLNTLNPTDSVATHWEMDQIIEKKLTRKLHLWRNGEELSQSQVREWLTRWKFIRGL